MKCLDCNYGCGAPYNLPFPYKIEHKDKVSKFNCGNQTISGNCVEDISSKKRGTAPKCSSSSFSSSSNFNSIFSSNSNSDFNSNSNSNYYSNSNSNSGSNSN